MCCEDDGCQDGDEDGYDEHILDGQLVHQRLTDFEACHPTGFYFSLNENLIILLRRRGRRCLLKNWNVTPGRAVVWS